MNTHTRADNVLFTSCSCWYFEINRKPVQSDKCMRVHISVFLCGKKRTSFLFDVPLVLNFHRKKHQCEKQRRNNRLKKKTVVYRFNSFHCFTYCSISQHHSPSTPEIYSIPLLFTGSFAVSFGDHLRSGIICGTVCMFKSGKLKLSDFHDYFHLSWWPFYLWTIAGGYWLFVLIVSFSFINSL